ncbi:hypothetical protein SmJEL517_g03135 [Synchytrium microbalum]|uniref:Cation-transporting P-type ATPase C-terminal domain-containing protein n=1 Tax=Synchytrium microbalum TaxID=1806994 RepID=A0A507C9D2_9FUNG|nr:uncharacterized protein SmJEL517_g03135 [Synchytrium microbalum]TPX34153.1 hypothetical protein SmJEL517_g03135 [Synchytrium microbalum]
MAFCAPKEEVDLGIQPLRSSISANPVITGLSNDEARISLLHEAEKVLIEQHPRVSLTPAVIGYLLRPENIVTYLSILGLLADFICSRVSGSTYVSRDAAILVEAVLLAVVATWNLYMWSRELHLTVLEMRTRVQRLLDQLNMFSLSQKQEMKIPTHIPTVALVRVYRSKMWQNHPTGLLVQGDVIQLSLGDTTPCKLQLLQPVSNGWVLEKFILYRNVMLTPKVLESPDEDEAEIDPESPIKAWPPNEGGTTAGQYYFKVLETHIGDTLKAALLIRRPETIIVRQLQMLGNLFSRYIVWVMILIPFIINLARFLIRTDAYEGPRYALAVQMLITLQVYVLLPLLPLSIPTLAIAARSYGNAQILSLFDALQTSKAEFKDDEDVDEFDIAPPPTKDIHLDPRVVWKKFLAQMTDIDVGSLARTTGLVESLASTTVICALDREGTIASPIPSVEQLFFLDQEGEPVVIDVIEDQNEAHGIYFEDRDWEKHIKLLKPLGLETLLNTDCTVFQGRKRNDNHRKSNNMHLHGRVQPARQTCLCRIGREIGFIDDALKSFVSRKIIQTFAPLHPSVSQTEALYHFEIPSMYSQVFEETNSGTLQLFSDGTWDLVLDLCGEYWNGKTLELMTESIEEEINEFAQKCSIGDMQVVAYAYRPVLKLPENVTGNTLLDGDLVYIELGDSTEDHLHASESGRISPPHLLSPITSSTGNGVPVDLNGAQRPSISSLDQQTQSIISRSKDYSAGHSPMGHTRPITARILSEVDSIDSGVAMEKDRFFRELIKGQTFLGMAAMSYQPKSDVVSFIEDLRLAGIRFVYFSSSPERESKSFAGEKLGLEIDWNSCILLSSSDSSYLDPHDRKAQLPRGIDNIRNHIKNVDDIPLHVSLFAECNPRTTREMVKIFQENGEVVCCIGSSLYDSNVELFAGADIGIGVEPLSVLKSRGHTTGPISPLVAQSSFTTLPCALYLHFDTSFYILTQVIGEARTLAANARQGFLFLVGGLSCISTILVFSYCLLLPPIMTGYQIIWLSWLMLPLISTAFLFTEADEDVMIMMPVKNQEHLKDIWRYSWYLTARFLVPVGTTVAVYAMSLGDLIYRTEVTTIFGPYEVLDERSRWAVLVAQNLGIVTYVLCVGKKKVIHAVESMIDNSITFVVCLQ